MQGQANLLGPSCVTGAFMHDCGYSLAAIHGCNYRNGMLGWCDGLFALPAAAA